MTISADHTAHGLGPAYDQETLRTIASRVLWLSSAIVDAAHAGRANHSGVKVGGQDSEEEDWGHPTAHYPFSADGQASLTRDLVRWGARTGVLSGIRQWGPDGVTGPFGAMSVFDLHDKQAIARPALDAVAQALSP